MTEITTPESVYQFLRMLGKGRADVRLVAGRLVIDGHRTLNGICELAGMATLDEHRHQGITMTITSKAVQQAGRVY